jgi:hypothetical protein
MKKILLSSLIMLGICGAASAQNATGAKPMKNQASTTSTSAAAPTPQKSAMVQPAANVDSAPVAVAADVEAAKAPVTTPAPVRTAQKTVNADGVTVVSEDSKANEAKAAAAKAANAKKTQQ